MVKILNYQENKKEEILFSILNTLNKSGLVVFPSDTVYGFLAKADDEIAIKKLLAFKNRPPGKAISIFVNSFLMLKEYVFVNKKQERILKSILPGPFTVVLPSKRKTSSLLESEKKTLGVRLTNFSLINELISQLGKPTTATSANISGRHPHYSIKSFLKQVPKSKLGLIDLILDYGSLAKNKPSTVIDLTGEEIKILRRGDIQFTQSKSFISINEEQTKKIARDLINSYIKKAKKIKKSLIILLKGELGIGKTIFAKGVGKYFNLKNIISPSFVIYYEYFLEKFGFKKLFHFDFYNIREKEELKYLGLEKIFKEKNLIIIEWGEKTGEIIDYLIKKGEVVWVEFTYIKRNKRKITIKFSF